MRIHEKKKKRGRAQKQLVRMRLCTYIYENLFASQLVSYEFYKDSRIC